MYIFYPVGGLANRMRVIDSAFHYASMNNQSCRIYWLKDDGLNCSFASIWKPFDQLIDSDSKILPLFFKLRRKSGFIRWMLGVLEKWNYLKVFSEDEFQSLTEDACSGKLNNYRHSVVCSYSTFFPAEVFQSDLFQLRDDVKLLVKEETILFDKNTIGVHIRRTDNIDSILNSPLELFVIHMQQEIQKNKNTQFYLATDSEDVKVELTTLFGNKLIVPNAKAERDTQQGIIQAVVELYSLSSTRKIMGSFFSSFSEMAATLGEIQLEVVKK